MKSEYTKGECNCKVSISGTIFYCPLHKSAPKLYEACRDVAYLINDIKPFGNEVAQQISANVKFIISEKLEQAIALVEGNQ